MLNIPAPCGCVKEMRKFRTSSVWKRTKRHSAIASSTHHTARTHISYPEPRHISPILSCPPISLLCQNLTASSIHCRLPGGYHRRRPLQLGGPTAAILPLQILAALLGLDDGSPRCPGLVPFRIHGVISRGNALLLLLWMVLRLRLLQPHA